MRRSSHAAALIGLAVAVTLTGCATPAPVETPAASPSASASQPPVEPVVIGPAEMPPVAFGGDCAKALSADDVAEVLGVPVTAEAVESEDYLVNMGGLACEWTAESGASVELEVVPRAGLDGAVFPEEYEASFFDQCSYDGSCRWQGGDDAVWLALTFRAIDGAAQDDVDAWGEAVGARVTANHAAAEAPPWTRDRTGWWPVLDCAQVADAVGVQLGEAPTGEMSGWDADLPPAAYVLAIEGARVTRCSLDGVDGTTSAMVSIEPGMGGVPVDGATAVELGVPGITAFSVADEYQLPYLLTDGVNRIRLSVRADGPDGETRLLTAIAAAAASGFQ